MTPPGSKRILSAGVPAELGAALALAGGPTALARILLVSRQTVHRWMTGDRKLEGAALFGVRAFVRRSSDFLDD